MNLIVCANDTEGTFKLPTPILNACSMEACAPTAHAVAQLAAQRILDVCRRRDADADAKEGAKARARANLVMHHTVVMLHTRPLYAAAVSHFLAGAQKAWGTHDTDTKDWVFTAWKNPRSMHDLSVQQGFEFADNRATRSFANAAAWAWEGQKQAEDLHDEQSKRAFGVLLAFVLSLPRQLQVLHVSNTLVHALTFDVAWPRIVNVAAMLGAGFSKKTDDVMAQLLTDQVCFFLSTRAPDALLAAQGTFVSSSSRVSLSSPFAPLGESSAAKTTQTAGPFASLCSGFGLETCPATLIASASYEDHTSNGSAFIEPVARLVVLLRSLWNLLERDPSTLHVYVCVTEYDFEEDLISDDEDKH
jgi:hypothetical protein